MAGGTREFEDVGRNEVYMNMCVFYCVFGYESYAMQDENLCIKPNARNKEREHNVDIKRQS